MSFEIDLTGKTVIISGVSSGIGLGIAKMFARANADIAGCALEPADHVNVQELRNLVHHESGKYPFYVQADVTNLRDTENFVDQTIQKYGRIDILASNAGANIFRGVTDCSREDWLHNMNLNLESHFNIARLCKPYLEITGKGVIIVTSSCHAFSTMPGIFPYNIAKAGLKALVQSLTLEWGPAIRILGVAPGFIETEPFRKYFNSFAEPETEKLKVLNKYPLKRFGTPDEIGGWFVFLSSEYAAYAGGQTYLVDGGRSAAMSDE
jgi:NAD(P)-dependent dehydrogenase (short-subunit alcohol dehydrogenase family)